MYCPCMSSQMPLLHAVCVVIVKAAPGELIPTVCAERPGVQQQRAKNLWEWVLTAVGEHGPEKLSEQLSLVGRS